MFKSQSGRTMLETMMVLGIMGVLSVGGIYMYRRGINDVRADGIMKDVLARASQEKGNADLSRSGVGGKLVYTPDYKSKSGKYKTKGRYGYTFEIESSSTSKNIEIKVGGGIPKDVCNALKTKYKTYQSTPLKKIVVVGGTKTIDILKRECPDEIPTLKFVFEYD